MPFLVDSIANELNRRELGVHLLAHPVLAARRDLDGDLIEVATEAGERARPESMMYLEIDRQGTQGADRAQLDDLAAALSPGLGEERLADQASRSPLRGPHCTLHATHSARSPTGREYEHVLQ